MERANRPVRVAIYTRKSVEDAEDKQFNSIDAQRQMCESFIAAKAAEGWIAMPERFDDYGYSGGDLNRPACRSGSTTTATAAAISTAPPTVG